MKHTPAPWKASTNPDNDEIVIRDKDNIILANLESDVYLKNRVREITQANAKLIAAAPDMLLVLQEAVNHSHVYETNPVLIDLFEATIRKATI
jgi:hypothetical protein